MPTLCMEGDGLQSFRVSILIFVPLSLDCKESLIFLFRHSRSRACVRGERHSCDSSFLPSISLLLHSLCMAQRKERQLPAVYTDLIWATDYYVSLITKLLYWALFKGIMSVVYLNFCSIWVPAHCYRYREFGHEHWESSKFARKYKVKKWPQFS